VKNTVGLILVRKSFNCFNLYIIDIDMTKELWSILWVAFIWCCSHDKLGDAMMRNKLHKPFGNFILYNCYFPTTELPNRNDNRKSWNFGILNLSILECASWLFQEEGTTEDERVIWPFVPFVFCISGHTHLVSALPSPAPSFGRRRPLVDPSWMERNFHYLIFGWNSICLDGER